MDIRRIEMKNVMTHVDSTVDLPENGIVVVRGANGAGKSALIEAVAAAGWHKTLRGTPWWRAGEAAEAKLELADGLEIVRGRGGSKNTLSFTGGEDFDTATQAQKGLDALIPSFDVWRRTSVFSSSDASHFSLATDAERKQLIESLLGLDRFDAALKACRGDLKHARMKLAEAEGALNTARVRLEGSETRLADATADLGDPPPNPDLKRMSKTVGVLRGLREERDRLRSERSALGRTRVPEEQAQARFLARQLHELADPTCPTCGQEIDDAHLADIRKALAAAQKVVDRDAAERAEEGATLDGLLEELSEELADFEAEHSTLREQSAVRAAYEQRADALKARRSAIEAEIEKQTKARDEYAAAAAEYRQKVAELEVADKALGLRGIRSQVLGRALGGIEAVANVWLSRLFPGVSVQLTPDSAKASGGVSEKIALVVSGLPHDFGYRAASGGQRRRVDIALLLALAEVAAGAAGVQPGTLFMDEVTDALDDEGMAVLADVLSDLSQSRCLVVITHSDTVADLLKPSLRLYAQDGTLLPV